MVHMAHAYLTEKQMPRAFWFYAVVHSARMMNAIPGKILGRIASPFLLVHWVGHDKRTRIPLFSLCYFHHKKDGDLKRSKHQAHSMDGVIIGRSPTSNALLVYNPRNKQYYEPDSYRIDSYRLPGSVYRDLKYDGGLLCSLYHDDNPPIEELYPPTLGEYRALRKKGAPKAIPTMCVLTIKKDENLLPLRAKSRIIVLGNHEDRIWSKSDALLLFFIRIPFAF